MNNIPMTFEQQEELIAELEEYRKDAERYRIASAGVAVSGFCVARLNSNGEVELMGCDVADEAIDQAMKGGEL